MIHTIDLSVDVEITPEELAELFSSMDHIEMRKFFNYIGDKFDSLDFALQLNAVGDDSDGSAVQLTKRARNNMRIIGDC